jgi:hypothetical protein
MPKFTIDGHTFEAESSMDGVLVNPKLPPRFDSTPNEERPETQRRKWWDRPFIVSYSDMSAGATCSEEQKEKMRAAWLEAWPSGTRWDVRCLDGGAWDRSTCWGSFATLEGAVQCAKTGPTWGGMALVRRAADNEGAEVERGIAEVWGRMRDALRARGFHVVDGDGSTRAIAECAHGVAGVVYTLGTLRAEPARGLLAVAGAAGMLATAARLFVASRGEASAAARAAVLAGDIFDHVIGDLPQAHPARADA